MFSHLQAADYLYDGYWMKRSFMTQNEFTDLSNIQATIDTLKITDVVLAFVVNLKKWSLILMYQGQLMLIYA
ncbi:hypothetical protein SUGI_1122880 [Cryptomeria japonica]|nr:hypothetical protein SUGI_1122880 [Cryptomeria japonica]